MFGAETDSSYTDIIMWVYRAVWSNMKHLPIGTIVRSTIGKYPNRVCTVRIIGKCTDNGIYNVHLENGPSAFHCYQQIYSENIREVLD